MAPEPGKKFWAGDIHLRVFGKQKSVETRRLWDAHIGYVLNCVF